MVVRIRLSMHGRRHNRIFHLVAINGRKARDAKPMETLGVYDPAMKLGEKHKTVEWSVGRINYWLGVGAVPSKTVVRLLEVGGVIPPDSKYHPKVLGPRVPLPTVNLESLKARKLWDSHLAEESEETKVEGAELQGADVVTLEASTNQAASGHAPPHVKTPTSTSS